MIKKIAVSSLCMQILFSSCTASAAPLELSQNLNDQNMKVMFEVHAPWNILDGVGHEVSGKTSLATNGNPDGLRASVFVQKLRYKAGLSVAGRLVAAWLRANPPTPASFKIGKSLLSCEPKSISDTKPCNGSVDGELMIWGKNYTMDVPVEMKPAQKGFLLTGVKKINWGDYGFGDPSSSISSLKPVIDLNFSIELPPIQEKSSP